MTGLFLDYPNTPQANYGRDYLKQDMKAAGQSLTGLASSSYSTLFLPIFAAPRTPTAMDVFLLVFRRVNNNSS